MAAILSTCNNYMTLIGAISVAYVTLRIVITSWNGFRVYVLSPLLGLGADLKSLGSWAVVTGSTDGIGREYALELARRGMNVALISRSADKLQHVADEIESKYHVGTKCIVIDFTGGLDIFKQIADELTGLEVGVLVNNVGMCYDFGHLLTEHATDEHYAQLVTVNCNAVTFMTRLALPQMVERKKGAIINISSSAGALPLPCFSVYSATKAYVDFFTRGIQAEYRSKGIIVQSVLPGFVVSKMSKVDRVTFATPTPERYVRSAIATVGVESRTFGYWFHAIQALVSIDLIPEWISSRVAFFTMAKFGEHVQSREKRAE